MRNMTNKQFLAKKAKARKNKDYQIFGELVGLGNLIPNCQVTWDKTLHNTASDDVAISEINLRMAVSTQTGRGERPHFKGKVIGRGGYEYKVHAWLNEGGRIRIEIIQ